MSAASPWMKFYPQDWRADEKLRLCSLAARGMWIEMLALMHRSERYGHLLIGGHVPTDAQLAVQVGSSTPEVSEMIGQLEAAGVFSRAVGGAIYSRRMTRDEKKAKTARLNGKRGGNPKLRKQKENGASDKGQDKASDNGGLKPQKPEARYQSSDTNVSGVPPPDPVKELFDRGVALLMAAGKSEVESRKLVGMWRRDLGDERASELLKQAADKTDPLSWIQAAAKRQDSQVDELIASVAQRYRPRAAEAAPQPQGARR